MKEFLIYFAAIVVFMVWFFGSLALAFCGIIVALWGGSLWWLTLTVLGALLFAAGMAAGMAADANDW